MIYKRSQIAPQSDTNELKVCSNRFERDSLTIPIIM